MKIHICVVCISDLELISSPWEYITTKSDSLISTVTLLPQINHSNVIKNTYMHSCLGTVIYVTTPEHNTHRHTLAVCFYLSPCWKSRTFHRLPPPWLNAENKIKEGDKFFLFYLILFNFSLSSRWKRWTPHSCLKHRGLPLCWAHPAC